MKFETPPVPYDLGMTDGTDGSKVIFLLALSISSQSVVSRSEKIDTMVLMIATFSQRHRGVAIRK
jgi:hypothetical protein